MQNGFFKTGLSNITSNIACENKKLEIDCGNGMVIHILDSIYGRINGLSCTFDPPDYSSNPAHVECHEKYGYRVVREKCEGNRSCSLDVKPEQFSLDDDPSCSHIPHKYLKVNYGCVSQKGNKQNYFPGYVVQIKWISISVGL